jgi:DNA topoisomerase-2
MFNAESKLHKYESVEEIIDDFYNTRIQLYQTRKNSQIKHMERVLMKLSNRARYILDTLSGKVDLRKKKNLEVQEMLENLKYDKLDGDFKYLIKMPMDSVTEEHVAHILKEKADTELELDVLKKTTPNEMWLKELVVFEKEYDKYKQKRSNLNKTTTK